MRLRSQLAGLALCAAALAGCGGGDDGPGPTGPPSDAVITFTSAANDLNALDLREKLIVLPGVQDIIYDQAEKRLRVDFKSDATAAQKDAVVKAADADPTVSGIVSDGKAVSDGPAQQPAPGASST